MAPTRASMQTLAATKLGLEDWQTISLRKMICPAGFPQTFCDKIPGLFKDFSRTKHVFSRTLMCYKLKHFCSQVTKN